jgi:L-fucono-1,5-lactonase
MAPALATGCHTLDVGRREVIDCHTHFYDPTRPQGVPWPGKNETQLYRRVLPGDYKRLARPQGITGTVVIEASAWLEDNQWILDLARDESFIKGFVGNVPPGSDDFRRHIRRFARDPLFRGIRVSFGDVPKLNDPAKLRDLHALVDQDLSLDLNGGTESLATVRAVASALPKLRIIIDHVANVRIDGGDPPADWRKGLLEAAARPNVFCKVSGLVEGSGKRQNAPADLSFYRPVLDHVWACFGEDRVVYGSNWPVSELFADFATVHELARSYTAEKGPRAERNFFAENARLFYKWLPRT